MEVNNNKNRKGKKGKKQAENATVTNNNNNNNKSKNNTTQSNNGSTSQKKPKNPKKKSKGWCWSIFQALAWGGVSAACFYTVIPFVFWYFPEMSSFIIFSNRFRWPPIGSLNKPSDFGLNHTRNLYLNPRRSIEIGVWHVLPKSIADSNTVLSDSEYDQSLSEQKLPVVLYLHGNTGTRAGWHRIEIYKLFSALNYHTITFDYRGYAESTGVPSEDGVVEDGQFLFNWIKQRVSKDTPIILWGHSLGTGVATKLAKNLCDEGLPPTAVVLEAPFTNIINATYHHPFLIGGIQHIRERAGKGNSIQVLATNVTMTLGRNWTWFTGRILTLLHLNHPFNLFKSLKLKITDFVRRSGIEFASDESISSVTSPIMILHAEDDFLIPVRMGQELYDIGMETRPKGSGPMKFVTFEASKGYGHKHIHKAPELSEIISSFVKTSVESGF